MNMTIEKRGPLDRLLWLIIKSELFISWINVLWEI